MKNTNYHRINIKHILFKISFLVLLFGNISLLKAQIIVPFTQRTSIYTPTKKIYKIKGDFTLIGNTNLTLQTYGDSTLNSNNEMQYVDVDSDPNTLNSSSADLTFSTENGAIPNCSNVIYAGLYWTGRASDGNSSSDTFSVTHNGVTKDYDKRKVYLKGPTASSYTTITAGLNDIYYPTTSDGFMYSGYAEITDYVRENGLGTYTLADIALIEGNGGGTGYYGGWGIYVVYENSKMKNRDVTIFDGHAYVAGGTTTNFELPISGFNTVQAGPVGMELGLMAGEGDVGIEGDYFQIQKQSDASYLSLNHSGNATNNFFNSSIQTGGNTRNPNLLNNTGLDISKFTIPNPGNSVITNNQTSTNFKYGSNQDTYVIFAIAMSVCAYVPDIPAVITATAINNSPPGSQPYTVLPGQIIDYSVNVYNHGTEGTTNSNITIPIPFGATFVPGSIINSIYFTPLPLPNNAHFDPLLGGNGSIVWDISTLPLPADPETILANLTFKLKATEDCSILKNPNCNPKININGSNTGTGAISGVNYSQGLIQGYYSGTCIGTPITANLNIDINATDYIAQHCQDVVTNYDFYYCNFNGTIPLSQISGTFPSGTRFYNQFPVTASSIEYTSTNPFPATIGNSTYYAVPPNANGCYFVFSITLYNGNIVTTPPPSSIPGCNIQAITGLSFSSIAVTITNQQFIDAGGTINNATLINSISYSDTFSGSCPITVTRTFSITTNCKNGNIIMPTQTIQINDTTLPTASNPAPLILSGFNGTFPAPDITVVIDEEDNCSTPVVAFVSDGIPLLIGCTETTIRTYSVTDACLNTINVTQNLIRSFDLTPPVIPTLADVTGQCSATATIPSTTDNCSQTPIIGTTNDPLTYTTQGTHAIDWTFDDGHGNSIHAYQNVIVHDTTPPVIPILIDVTGQCSATATIPSTTDNCSQTPIIGTTTDALTYTTQGTHTIDWTFDDGHGNSIHVYQNVIIHDTTPPVTPVLANVTGQCSATATIPSTTDNCSQTPIFGITINPLTYNTQGTHTIDWIFDDGNGNSIHVFQNVIVHDTTPPVVPVLADVIGQCSATATVPSTTDNCSQAPIENITNNLLQSTIIGTTTDPLTYTTQGIHVIHWTFNDGNGNSIQVNQNVIVDDTVNPVTPILADITGQCSATATVPSTTDNCSQTPIVGTTLDPLTYTTQGTHIIHWIFNDGNGNSIQVNQNVIVNDTVNPVTPILPDLTGQCSVTATAPTTTDNCSQTPIIGTTTDALTYTTQGTHVIHWTFNDGNGNSIQVNQNAIVHDTTPPVIPVLADVTGQCSATATVPSTTDNCSELPIIGTTIDPLTYTTQGTFIIHWHFNDGHGNSIVVSQNVMVHDTVNPVAPILADITGQCSATAPIPFTTDNCSQTPIAGTTTDPITYNIQGSFVIHWLFNDGNGNIILVDQNVIIQDTTPPIAPMLSDVTGQCSATAPVPSTYDNCSEVSLMPILGTTTDPLTYTTQGTHVIHWTFDDGHGNTTQVNQNVIVHDTIPPVVPILSDVTGQCSATAMVPSTTDNCSVLPIIGTTTDALTYTTQGTHVIHWTFDDGHGNTTQVNQNVIILDTTLPVTPVLADVTGQCSATATVPSTTDNCSQMPIIGTTTDALTYTSQGTHVIHWTFDDGHGNSIVVNQNVIVHDTTPPVTPVLADVTGQCSATASVPSTSDNCSDVAIIGTTTDPLSYYTQGTHTIHWVFNDGNGNSIHVNQDVIVHDTTLPVTPMLSDIIGQCSATASVPFTTDNCSETPIIGTTTDAITYTSQGTHIIHWTFDDGHGNSIQVNQNVIVHDTTLPVTPVLADVTGQCSATATVPSTTDNCSELPILGTTSDSLTYTTQGTHVIHWTFDDGHGNSIVVNQNVIIQDTTPPVTPMLVNVTGLCSVTLDVPTTTDNCAGIITGATNDPLTYSTHGSHVVHWTFDDGNGNIFTVNQNVTVTQDDIIVHNAFSPNNDGLNEFFNIENIENTVCFPTNKVEIYNRWGVLVYETDQYDNNSRVFKGISEGRVTIDRAMELPTGTYYYILNYTTSEGEYLNKKGYVYLSK